MKTKTTNLLLLLLFVATLSFRLFFSLHLETYSSGEAYFNQRIITTLLQEKHFLYTDPLSYGGRTYLFPPFFYFFLAVLSFGSKILLKILPELFLSSTVFITYFLSYEITQDKWTSLLGATLSSFLPLYLWETTNQLSINSLFIPLLFLSLYSFLHLEKKTSLWIFIISTFLIPLTSPHAYLLLLIFLFYFLLQAGGALTPSKLEKEAATLAFFLIPLFSLILYKKTFLTYGLSFIWQNIPSIILAEQFRPLSGLELVLTTGIVPLLLGVFSLYLGLHKDKNKAVTLLSALILAALTLLSLRLVTISTGLLFLGLGFSIISPLAVSKFYHFLEISTFSRFKKIITTSLLLLLFFTTFLPAYTQMQHLQGVDPQTIKDFTLLKEQTTAQDVILGNIEEGFLITSIAERKNVLDNHFLLAARPVERLHDVDIIYTTWSQAKAEEYLRKYHVTIIYLSKQTQTLYGITSLSYATTPCFKTEGRIIHVLC